MVRLVHRLIISGILIAAIFAFPSPSQSQSFSVVTSTAADGLNYDYSFTLNYDQAGTVLSLTDPIYDWTFYMDPTVSAPTQVLLPIGWKYNYDSGSGQFDFYTEGPSGFGNGDFGPDVIQPGASLAGFGLTTPAAPDQSIAFATDEQFNQDSTLATLPTSIPAAVPEASTTVSLGLLLALGLGGGVIAARRKKTNEKAAASLP